MTRAALVGTVLLALVLNAVPSQAASLTSKKVAAGVLVTRDDGRRYLAYAHSAGAVRVIDTTTYKTRTYPTPAGCRFADLGPDRTLLWSCDKKTDRGWGTGLTYNFDTRAGGTLTAGIDGDPTDARTTSYEAIGRRWARVVFGVADQYSEWYVNRQTGEQIKPDFGRSEIADLDSETLSRSLCSGMQRPLVPYIRDTLVPGPLEISGTRAAAFSYTDNSGKLTSRVLLQRCGHKAVTLQSCAEHKGHLCGYPLINSRIVAWTDRRQDPGTRQTIVNSTRLHVYSLKTKRTKTLKLRNPVGLALISHRLYLTSPGQLRRVGHSGA